MSKMILLLLLCIPGDISHFTSPFEYTVEQATFVEAKSAVVIPQGDKVLIEAVDLSPEQQPGLKLTVPGSERIEVTRLVTVVIDGQEVDLGVYPPQEKTPDKDGIYRIVGQSGSKYGIRTLGENREQIYVEIEGEPEPPVPPPASLESLKDTVRECVTKLNDPITQQYIKEELDGAESFEDIRTAIRDGLLKSMRELNPPYKDWENGFRVPINDEISKLDTKDPTAIAKAIAGEM